MESLNAKIARLGELQGALTRSLRLQAFMPDAFAHGSCKIGGRGNVTYRPREARVVFTLGDGTRRELPLIETPREFWPASMAAEFDAIPRAIRPRLRPRDQFPLNGDSRNA